MSEETANEKDEQEKEHLRGEVLLCGFITKALLAKTQVYCSWFSYLVSNVR